MKSDIKLSISKFIKFFTPYEWFLLVTIITLNILISIINDELALLQSIAAISGVLCVVLVAKGHIANYLFGLIQVSLYAYCSWGVGYWGEVALNALYYVPMQFIGFFMWKKRMRDGSKTEVKARNLSAKQRIILSIVSVILVIVGAQALKYFDDPAPYLDSATTFLSIIAMLLMVKTYTEQWYLWVAVNIATIIMWYMAYANGNSNALIVCTMWFVYLLNSINGLINWSRDARKEAKNEALNNF
ncbi:MAG: nicotinamide riboside transporter PnuC [Bacteroidales bacterium]|nr:nicotinamide riboside transporter PnuC [Bacteroidales bacterium]MDD4633649.1 nicotinamide riboside transporter PnuC [Bacteroidales bacterium]